MDPDCEPSLIAAMNSRAAILMGIKIWQPEIRYLES